MAGGGAVPPRPAAVALRAVEEKPRGFRVLPRRWVVERTFAWLGLSRRFSKGLRAPAGNIGGHDLRRDEPAHAAQAGGGSVRSFASSAPNLLFAKLPLNITVSEEKSQKRAGAPLLSRNPPPAYPLCEGCLAVPQAGRHVPKAASLRYLA
jgi:hypothetical protein